MVSPVNFGSYQSFYSAYTPTRCSSYQNPVFTGYNNEPAKTNSKLTETQQWGIATVVAVGLAIVGDFVFAKGKHVKSILGMAEKEGASIKPKSSGTPTPTGSAPKPLEAPNPQPTGAPDVKPPEPVPGKPQGQVSEEKPIIQQEQQVPNDYVPPEPKPIERPISNENQIPVEQPKPQPTEIPKPDNSQRETDKIRAKWKQQQKQRFDSIKDKISDKIQTQVKDKNSNIVNAEISAKQGYHADYRREIIVNGKVVGASENYIHPDCEFIPNLPESYQYGQSALEIKYLGTSTSYKGSGSELIKAAIQDSKNAGYEGRVFVNACGGSLPPDFGFIGAGKYGSSPVPFYYKQGFRFGDEELDKQVLLGIEEMSRTGIYPKTAPQSGIMHLP